MEYIEEMWQLAVGGKLQGIWFWAAIYWFVVCFYSVIRQILTRKWVNTKGTLDKLGLDKFGHENILSDQDYVSDTLYSYSVNGKAYQGKRVSPWVITASHNARFILKKQLAGVQRLANNQVLVFYDASNPAKSFLILPSKVGILITFLICLTPAIAYWFRFYG